MPVSRTLVELVLAFANVRPDQREEARRWFGADDPDPGEPSGDPV